MNTKRREREEPKTNPFHSISLDIIFKEKSLLVEIIHSTGEREPISLIEGQNEMQFDQIGQVLTGVGNETKNGNEYFSTFVEKLFSQPTKVNDQKIVYRDKEYSLFPETLFALVMNKYKVKAMEKGIIKRTYFSTPPQTLFLTNRRIKNSLKLIGLFQPKKKTSNTKMAHQKALCDEMIQRGIVKSFFKERVTFKEYKEIENDIGYVYQSILYFTKEDRQLHYQHQPDFIMPVDIDEIDNYCFSNCIRLESLSIPKTVTAIGKCCFQHCVHLSSIQLPTGLKFMGKKCFFNCSSLQSITLPSLLTSFRNDWFHQCHSLTSISFPSTMKSLGSNGVSHYHSLKEIQLPSLLTSIPFDCFDGCTTLTKITIDNPKWKLQGDRLFFYGETVESVSVPSSVSLYNNRTVTITPLKMFITPPTIKAIGDYCFAHCSKITKITIPSTVTSIGKGAFYNCHQLLSMGTLSNKYIEQSMKSQIPLSEYQMMKLEEWTRMKVHSLLFDSSRDNWAIDTSVFDRIIKNKHHIVILIHVSSELTVGGYLSSQITEIEQGIEDHNCFIFSFEGNMTNQYHIKQDHAYNAFEVYPASSRTLFTFGNAGLWINKQHKQSSFIQKSLSSFTLHNYTQQKTVKFLPKQILILQFQ